MKDKSVPGTAQHGPEEGAVMADRANQNKAGERKGSEEEAGVVVPVPLETFCK